MTKNKDFGPIWNEIKSKKIEIFNLPEQIVEMHFEPVSEDAKQLILKRIKNLPLGAALPALEAILADFILLPEKKKGPLPIGINKPAPQFKYQLEQQNDYLVISLVK